MIRILARTQEFVHFLKISKPHISTDKIIVLFGWGRSFLFKESFLQKRKEMDGGTKRIRRECIVDGNPDKVHETFLSQVWWDGGFPFWVSMCLKTYQIEPPRDNDTGVGGIRQVPTYLQEEIVGAEKGKFVEYRVRRKAWLPIAYHHGRVSFESIDDEMNEAKTKVVWEITYTAKLCFSGFLYILFAIMIGGFFLPRLRTSCKNTNNK